MKKANKRHAPKKAAAYLTTAALIGTLALPGGFGLTGGAASATGDLNGDGSVTHADVLILQNALLGKTTLTPTQAQNADVCADSDVNGLDLVRLRQMAMGAIAQSDAVLIHLNDSGITVEGDETGVTSVFADGKTITISASGSYAVDGSIKDGQILINVPDITADADSVDLYLQGVTMSSSTGAPCIYATSADKVKLICTSTNTFTDTAASANTEISGVIAAECDLTVTKNSTGTLDITSSMNRGIFTKDDLKLNGGTINVLTDVDDTSDADAIRANNTLEIDGAAVNIESSADGLKSNQEDVMISTGTVSIKAGNDAIQAVSAITISGGDVVACGDRGLTLDSDGSLAITGGSVLATATDYAFGSSVTVDTSLSTQTIIQLDYAAEWKKDHAITLQQGSSTVYEMTPIKKFTYVLASGSNLNDSTTYTLYTGGTQMTHDASTTGEFTTTGTRTQFTGVTELDGGISIDTSAAASLVYTESGITAYSAAGTVLEAPSNVTISGTTATVTLPGELSVSGTCSEGQLAVNVNKTTYADGLVVLNLEGLTLSNSTMAPIYIEAIGDEVELVSKSGSVNTISDGTSHTDTYTDSEGNVETVNGAIFSRDDLKLKGKGTLIVNGNTEDGIVCKNDLKLWNGTITVNAADDGIRGNDSVRIGDPDDTDYRTLSVTVNTNNSTYGGDGIKANSTDSDKGYITINGGTVNINSYSDGIQAEQTFTMNGGDLEITTYQGSDYTDSSSGNMPGGSWGGGMGNENNANSIDISAKGIKVVGLYDDAGTTWQSGGDLIINGGTITMDTSDDCLHCGGSMTLLGGTMNLATGDDGAHSDHTLTIGAEDGGYDAPYINITKSYEGIEGTDIVQNSGTVMVTSSDDGYNAAGGADSSGTSSGGSWGQGSWGSTTGNGSQTLTFNGGYTYVNASGDGLGSNGDICFNGGYLYVSQTGGGNSPLDCGDNNNSITYTGGVVIAAGSGDMFETPSSYSFLSNTSVSADQTITFTDAGGNVIMTFTLPNASSQMVMCCPESSVTCYTGGTISDATYFASQDDISRCGYGGTLSGGTTISAGGTTTGPGGNIGPGVWGF